MAHEPLDAQHAVQGAPRQAWSDRAELNLAVAIPGVKELRDLAPPLKRDLASFGIAAIGPLPRRLRYSLPVFQVLQARLRAVCAH